MDSESAAQQSAQQKHHKHMMFGKKQRYIEVFQCSGDDMNLVLQGGYQQFPSPPTISAKPLPSGMLPLPSRPQASPVQPLQVSIPPPLSIPLSLPQAVLPTATSTNHASVSVPANAGNQTQSSLIAQQQQQAHFIAHQNLMARQQAAAAAAQIQAAQQQHASDSMAFIPNFGFLQSPSAANMGNPSAAMNPTSVNPYAFSLGPQFGGPQFFYVPRPMLPMGLMPTPGLNPYASIPSAATGYVQAGLQNAATNATATTSALATTSAKRSYESAFRTDPMTMSTAKRVYHPNQSAANLYGGYNPYTQM